MEMSTSGVDGDMRGVASHPAARGANGLHGRWNSLSATEEGGFKGLTHSTHTQTDRQADSDGDGCGVLIRTKLSPSLNNLRFKIVVIRTQILDV